MSFFSQVVNPKVQRLKEQYNEITCNCVLRQAFKFANRTLYVVVNSNVFAQN